MELGILGAIALLLACSVSGALATTWKLHRRCLKLEEHVDGIEEILLSRRNREASRSRWDKAKTFEEQIAMFQAANAGPARAQRFSNDPVDASEAHGFIR